MNTVQMLMLITIIQTISCSIFCISQENGFTNEVLRISSIDTEIEDFQTFIQPTDALRAIDWCGENMMFPLSVLMQTINRPVYTRFGNKVYELSDVTELQDFTLDATQSIQ